MALEIERKFLVKSDRWRGLGKGVIYVQGYLNDHDEQTVRVRIAGDKAFLTIKGKTNGLSRLEFEYEIPFADATLMLQSLTKYSLVKKMRYQVVHHGHLWEIDEFLGKNTGLILAEIELKNENEAFDLPSWVGDEVSFDPRYYNSYLSKQPYTTWK